MKWKSFTRENKDAQRRQFLQSLNSNCVAHNWKFIEYWKNGGVRPLVPAAKKYIGDERGMGKRVVVLNELNILYQLFAYKELLLLEDIEGFGSWARSWYNEAKDHLNDIFEDGEIYSLDFIEWLKDNIFGDDFSECFGKKLKNRLRQKHPKNR